VITDYLVGQEESKVKSLQELFAAVREKVAAYRDEQDGLAIQKAEAAIDYAVGVFLTYGFHINTDLLFRTLLRRFDMLVRSSSKLKYGT
jgi:hypothetical protein